MSGDLSITVGEIGPVEIELYMFTIFALTGLFGTEFYQQPISKSLPEYFNPGFCIMGINSIIISLFFFGDILKSIFTNFKQTLYLLSCPLICFGIAMLYPLFGSHTFHHEFAAYSLVHCFSFNMFIFELMVANMCKRPFKVIGVQSILQLVPLAVHFCAPGLESITSKLIAVVLMFRFYVHLYLFTNQYIARTPSRGFLTIVSVKKQE